jgi:hypothetical protein
LRDRLFATRVGRLTDLGERGAFVDSHERDVRC